MREAHLILNLFAFVGVVVAASLPFFAATQVRMKMPTRARPGAVRAVVGGVWLGAVGAAVAAVASRPGLAAIAFVVHGAAVLALAALVPLPGRKQLAWAGPRIVQLGAGVLWWVAMAWAYAGSLADGVGERRVLSALVVAGFGQILAASIAYLVPVVRGGGHQRLAAGFARTRSWFGLALGNLAGLSALGAAHRLTAALLAIWVLDGLARTAFRPRLTAA